VDERQHTYAYLVGHLQPPRLRVFGSGNSSGRPF
jgi:hypothetical protein